jgi:hypothetical protein
MDAREVDERQGSSLRLEMHMCVSQKVRLGCLSTAAVRRKKYDNLYLVVIM